MSWNHTVPVGNFPRGTCKASSDPREQPASLHRGRNQQTGWQLTERQSMCACLSDAPSNSSADCLLEALHGVMLLRSNSSTASHWTRVETPDANQDWAVMAKEVGFEQIMAISTK